MLDAETLITTLAGPRPISDFIDKGPVRIFTWNGERVTVGEVEVKDSTRLVIPFRVELDDGSKLVLCTETLVLLRNGAPRFPEQLVSETSLLPLYTKSDSSGYPVYQEPGEWHRAALTPSDRNRWRRVSRMVAEWKLGRRCAPGDVVSYVSKDRMDCSPENLKFHRKERKKTEKKVGFAEPLFEAQRFLDRYNHKVVRTYLDTSRSLLSIRGLGTANLSVGGVFVSVDPE